MKQSIIAMALLASTAVPVMAQAIDVSVVGNITPASCTPVLGGGGVIDYGNINPTTLNATDYTTLTQKTVSFGINCDAPAKIALRATTMQLGSTAGNPENAYGVATAPVKLNGMTGGAVGLGFDGQDKIGGYAINLTSLLVDSKSVDRLYQKADMGNKWGKDTNGNLFTVSNVEVLLSWGTTGTIVPVAFEQMTGNLNIQAYINKISELDLSKPIALDGLTSIELVYL